LQAFESQPGLGSSGTIQYIQGSVAGASGLLKGRIGDIVQIGSSPESISHGFIFELRRDHTVLGLSDVNHPSLHQGQKVLTEFKPFDAPCGELTLGRVLDALGRTIAGLDDAGQTCNPSERVPIWGKAHVCGYQGRRKTAKGVPTGIGAMDVFHPIIEGQSIMIQGSDGSGKTALIDQIINNQAQFNDKGAVCVYVSIGHSLDRIFRLVQRLKSSGAMNRTSIVYAPPDNAALSYVAPFTGATMAEYWKNKGHKALVFYDSLTAHSHAYNMLTRRKVVSCYQKGHGVGLHGPLLERNVCLSNGGSLSTLFTVTDNLGEGGSESSAIVSELSSMAEDVLKLDWDTAESYFPNFKPEEALPGRICMGFDDTNLRNLSREIWSKLACSIELNDLASIADQLGISNYNDDENMDLTRQSMLQFADTVSALFHQQRSHVFCHREIGHILNSIQRRHPQLWN